MSLPNEKTVTEVNLYNKQKLGMRIKDRIKIESDILDKIEENGKGSG